jgi:hypothetical protein
MSSTRGHGLELAAKPPLPRWVRWFYDQRRAWALVLAALVLVGGWRSVVLLQRPAGLGQVTREFGAVAEFWLPPRPNPAGTRVLYQQATEGGIGIFWSELPQKQRVLLVEKPEKGFVVGEYSASGWSPDGRYFAYARRRGPGLGAEVVIGEGNTGAKVATVPVARGAVKELVWLSAQALAFVDNEQTFSRVEQLGPDRWQRPQPFGPPAPPKGTNGEDYNSSISC